MSKKSAVRSSLAPEPTSSEPAGHKSTVRPVSREESRSKETQGFHERRGSNDQQVLAPPKRGGWVLPLIGALLISNCLLITYFLWPKSSAILGSADEFESLSGQPRSSDGPSVSNDSPATGGRSVSSADFEQLSAGASIAAPSAGTDASVGDRASSLTGEMGLDSRENELAAEPMMPTARQRERLDVDKQGFNRLVGNPVAFASQLGFLSKKYPSTAISKVLRDVSIEMPLWESLVEWSEITSPEELGRLDGGGPDAARQLLQRGEKLRLGKSIEPYGEQFNQIATELRAIASRTDFAGIRIDSKLQSFLNEEWVSHLDLIVDRQGQSYFIRQGGIDKLTSTNVTFEYITDLRLNSRRKTIARSDAAKFSKPAPHCQMASVIREKLVATPDLVSQGWDTVFAKSLWYILSRRDAEALPRLEIFTRVLDVACRGSELLSNEFTEYRKTIDDADFIDRTANWVDGGDREARVAREQASSVLKKLSAISINRDRILGRTGLLTNETTSSSSPFHLRWVGWLDQVDGGAQWQANGCEDLPSETQLWVVTRSRDLTAKVVPVAIASAGEMRWLTTDPQTLKWGRPLFASSPTSRLNLPSRSSPDQNSSSISAEPAQ